MADTPNTPKKTLSIGGTLSVGSAPSAPRGGGQVSVEVRRRRFDAPSSFNNNVPSATTATSEEMQRRMAALQAAQDAEKKKQDDMQENLRKVTELQVQRVKDAAERAAAEDEARKAAQEAAAQAAKERAATRAGSGAGGVQSGTLASAGASAGRTIDSKAFTNTKVSAEDARKRAATTGKPEGRDLTSKRGRNAYLEDLADRQRASSAGRRGGRRGRRGQSDSAEFEQQGPAEKVFREVTIPEFITVAELAARMAEKASDVVKKLMGMGEFVTANQTIDQSTAEVIVSEFGHTPVLAQTTSLEETLLEGEDAAADLITRAPIVTIMGHVDHGKTTLLDTLRKANVVKGEAGGITQHIGAYQVKAPSGRLITFLDTPGHAAFTAMRARGAKVTDVVILVVAADDGIMPQTIEAIQHARAADVPLVVALNKMDKPNVNPQKVKNELLAQEVVLEEFGGNVPCVPVSGLTGMGLDQLEEIVLLQADILDLKANPKRRADGSVVEARLDKGRGPVATVVVSRGTLKVGDILVAGQYWGRVRGLVNDKGQNVKEAGPSMPVEILGLQGVPQAGDQFIVCENERIAKEAASQRDQNERERAQAARKMTLENLMERMAAEGQKDLNVIVKADVQGSTEAIAFALDQLNADQQQVRVKVISSGVGVITENDVNLASTASALVVGFNVRADATAREVADRAGIELRYYNIIYNLIDDIKAAMSGLLAPSQVEEVNGHAEIRAIFTFERTKIAGCMVTDGKISRGTKLRIIRDGKVIHTGELGSLRRGKEDSKDVAAGFECGMTFANYTDFKEGDVVETFSMKEVKRTIDDLKQAAAKQGNA
ncbi:MAG: translation initiation factor IF-2 [Blastochloris viridis]|uniref:Translation initiation factor IF-2 n=1 Tax=Blastochloris viridis TaxID=1079 RepID=A0A6N4R5L1_BLAVI|nr:MAG: translation initiation factor IF-2 [Blastochloris viridis]